MDLYQRQQFDFLLQTAVERLSERLQERYRGGESAWQAVQGGECQATIDDFVTAIFRDFLLDNIDGACFVLRAIPQKRCGQQLTYSSDQSVETIMIDLAQQHFRALLLAKVSEYLQQAASYQSVALGNRYPVGAEAS